MRGLPAACSTPVREGLAVRTDGEAAVAARRGVLELTLAMRDDAQPIGVNELSHHASTHAADGERWTTKSNPTLDESNHFYKFDASQCILCGRCVSACTDRQHIGAIGIAGLGKAARIAAFDEDPLGESTCHLVRLVRGGLPDRGVGGQARRGGAEDGFDGLPLLRSGLRDSRDG